jgi:uncharacterized protein (UPF0548 family)
MKPSWYVATVVIQCIIEGHSSGPWTCDEQIRVLRALDDDSAYEKALQLGKGEEHSYENADGQIVSWKFVGISDLEVISSASIKDGTEIKTHLFKSQEPSELVLPKDQLTVFQWELERQNRKSNSPHRQ